MIRPRTDSGGQPIYNVQEFIMDSEQDVQNLPSSVAAGSVAICIDTSNVYMLNSHGEWHKI